MGSCWNSPAAGRVSVFLKAMTPGRLTRLKWKVTHLRDSRQHRLDLMGREETKLGG